VVSVQARELFSQEPVIRRRERGVDFDFKVGERASDRREGVKETFVTLGVSYDLGGMNYFSGGTTPRSYRASLTVEEGESYESTTSDGKPYTMTSRSFMLFQGLGLFRSEPVARFNRKKLEAFAEEALARLRELAFEENEQVQAQVDQARSKVPVPA
jgi:hypothetical protein